MTKTAVAFAREAETLAPAPVTELRPLRRRLLLAGADPVMLDFAEDDLAVARGAISAIADRLNTVEGALRSSQTRGPDLMALALADGEEDLASLEASLGNLRRRLAQLAGRVR
ncbi:hypothetical protein [Anaeromyxobacter paludicola]|uniref:Uncharacterized protein n=1 Tax=Anaeromyxobacter paludicola TaxID=2918171 RepID=A0ABM7X5M3_9BACT|nr:hypothetical protein [Anaeromyxobacter paludicola]BDG07114.1 hypothetical protein AMPC_02270 [Anaeromyxobacter paludicola]